MKRKVRVYKPMAQQGMQQQAPDPQLVIGSVVNSLSNTMDDKGNVDYATLDQIQIELEKLYGTEGANQILQQALDQIKVGQTQQAPAQQAAPQAMRDPNYNPFAEEEAMNQQIMDEALTETPVDLVARRGLQTYQGDLNSQVEDGEAMGDFYTTYPKSSSDFMINTTAVEPVITYDPLRDVQPQTLTNQAHLNMLNAMYEDPFFSQQKLDYLGAMGALPTQNYRPPGYFTPEEQARIAQEAININEATAGEQQKKMSGGMTKKQYAKNVMNYVKQAGGMQEAEMVDNTDDMMNTRQNTLANFFNTLANQSQAGVVNEFAEGTYDQFNDYMQRGGQRRAMRQANRAMRRAGRAMRGMPMMPGFMPMPMTQFGPMNPFVSQFLPVNATASTNVNPYGIESIESVGRGLFRRPRTTINFFNPYDHMDRAVVDAETVDVVTETPVDGNNDSMDGKVQSQAKTNTEVEQVEAHSQKKDKGASDKKAKELDQSNTATNKDPRIAAMQEWKETQARRQAEGRDLSTGEFNPYRMLPNQGMWEDAMGELYSQPAAGVTPVASAVTPVGSPAGKSLAQKYPKLAAVVGQYMAQDPKRVMPQGIVARYPEYDIADIEAMQRELFPDRYKQLGGFVNPDLYKYVYGAQKKKAIDFELPEAQSGYMMGSGQGLPPVYDGRYPYNPAWRYDKRSQAPNFAGALLFGAAGAGLRKPVEYAGSWIKHKGSKGDYIGQPLTSITEKQDLKGRGKKWETTYGADAPKERRGKKDPQELADSKFDRRRRTADFFYKIGQRSGLNDGDNIFTKIGTKFEPWEEIPEDFGQTENLQTKAASPIASSAPTADEMNIMRMDPTPGMEPLANAINIEAPDANQYIVSDPSRGQINPKDSEEAQRLKREAASRKQLKTYAHLAGVMDPDENLAKIQKHTNRLYGPGSTAFNEIASSTYTDIPEEEILQNPDLEVYTPNMNVSNLSGQEFGMSNRNPMLPPVEGVDPAQSFVQIDEPFIPGYGPRDFGAQPVGAFDMSGIQQGQDYDRQSAYEDYIRRSMEAQDMTQRGVYGQDLIDQEFANRDDWFEVGIPQIQSNQARRAQQRADIAGRSFGRRSARGEGVGELGFKGTGTDFSSMIPYDEYLKDSTDYAVEAAMTDYSSIPDEEFFTDYAPAIQSLTSQYKMESDPILKEALGRDLLNLHREINSRSASLGRANRTNEDFRQEYLRAMSPQMLAEFMRTKKTGGALNKYQGSQASQVTSVQDGSAYPGALAISNYESPMVAFMDQGNPEIPYDQPVQYETNEYMGGDGTPQEETTPILGPKYKEKYKRKDMYNVDFPAMLDWINVGGHGLASIFEQAGRKWENFSSDEITKAQKSRDKGEENQWGLFRPDEMGSGLQFQAKKGGTYKEGQVTYLSEDQIREIMENGGEIEFV